MNLTKEQIKQYLESEVGQDVQTLIAYTILKTPTQVDDEVLDNVDDITEIIKAAVENINSLNPTDKDAKKAGVGILEKVAKLTKTAWDDRIIAILKPFIG